jgi:RimJ/RimL family protein N-acetyltransferase
MGTHARWPDIDPEGRPVRFAAVDWRPRPDEFEPVLFGPAIRLEPMREEHLDDLCRIGLDPEISRYMPDALNGQEQMAAWVGQAIAGRAARAAIPFVTILAGRQDAAGTVVGSTRFMNIDPRNRRMEIGATWIGRNWQRTRVNTEAKYLMLRHAFEALRCIRVELKTDSLNAPSRAAITRIGAVQEGVFRNHVITSEGRVRHSVYFSITEDDWPSVKARLEGMLAPRPGNPAA